MSYMSSRRNVEKEIDLIADASFAEMAEAVRHGVDRASVIQIHRNHLHQLAEDHSLNMPAWRIDHYLGAVYKCGVFAPNRVDAGDPETGKTSYRQRIHASGIVQVLLEDEFPMPESAAQIEAKARVQ